MKADRRSLAAFVLIALVWGSTWLVIKDQISAVPAAWSVTWRFAVAMAAMFALALWRGDRLRLTSAELRLAAVIALFQFCLNFQLIYQSEHILTSGLVAVLFAVTLVPNAVLARLVLGSPITARFALGSGIALAGIGLLLFNEYKVAPTGLNVGLGAAMVAGAILSVSVGNLLQASERARGIPVLALMAWGMLFGVGLNAGIALLASGPPQIDWRPGYLAGILYLGLAGSALTFPIYSWLIRQWGPGPAAYNGVLVPVVAMALSTLFEGYHWGAAAVAGSVLALAGLVIALSGRK